MWNRIASSSDLVELWASNQVAQTSCAVHHEPLDAEHPVSVFGPEHYEPRYKYPLVVWLHSCHSSEAELEGVMPALSLQNYVGCAPRGPVSSKHDGRKFVWGHSISATAVAEEIVFEAIDHASRQFSIEPSRVFLAGFGSGATMAARIGLRYPELFAGVVAVCGRLPNENCIFSKIDKARSLPFLWMYGENSDQCGIDQVCETLPILHTAGLSLDIRQYPCGDELLTNMLSDANLWLMQHVTNQPVVETPMNAETFSTN